MNVLAASKPTHDLGELRAYRDGFSARCEAIYDSTLKSVKDLIEQKNNVPFLEIQHCVSSRFDEMLDSLLEDDVLDSALSDLELDSESRHLLRNLVHAIALPISLLPPTSHLEARLSGMIAFSAAGAAAGMFILGPLGHWLLGWPGEAGVLIGGPVGAACGIALLNSLVRSHLTISILQTVLIGVGVLDAVAQLVNQGKPLSWLRRTLFGDRSTGASLWKRLVAYLIGVIILNLAKPVQSNDKGSSLAVVGKAVKSWLAHHVDLIVLCGINLQTRPNQESRSGLQAQRSFLEAVRTLLIAGDCPGEGSEKLAGAALHFYGHLQSCGYEIRHLNRAMEQAVFSPELTPYFETFGKVSVGDTICALEPALLQENAVVLRGVVQRIRE